MSPLKTYIKLQILLLNFLEYLYLYPLCSFTSQIRVQLTIKKKKTLKPTRNYGRESAVTLSGPTAMKTAALGKMKRKEVV